MITEELVDRLVAATKEAKEATRECHEARRDLRLAIKEADDRLGKVREEVHLAVDELATAKTTECFEAIEFAKISSNLKDCLDRWMGLLTDATDVLHSLHQRERQLKDPLASVLGNGFRQRTDPMSGESAQTTS